MIYIIGYGAMAKAIASGLDIPFSVVGRDEEKLKKFAKAFNCKYYLLDDFEIDNKIILLAVKPYALEEVSLKLKGKAEVLISILAGKSIKALKIIPSKLYVRAMPNIGAKFKSSATAITGDKEAKKLAFDIFSQIGDVIWMDNDDEIDMATAFVGSGPAFLAIMAEAFSDGGVKEGLKREDANLLVRGLFEGFVPLLKDNHPALLKDAVMSPGGTTAAGYSALEEGKTRDSFIKAITRAYERTLK